MPRNTTADATSPATGEMRRGERGPDRKKIRRLFAKENRIVIKKTLSMALSLALIGGMALAASARTAKAAERDNRNDEYYMVTFLSGYSYWINCYRGFTDAAKVVGAKTVYAGTTEYDVNSAVTVLEQIIAKKPAGIAVTCMDADAYAPVINHAMELGIPVVTFDSDSPGSDRISYLGTKNFDAGATAARYIGEKLGGKGKVAAVTLTGQSNINERIEGFAKTIADEFPGIALAQIVDAGGDEVSCATNVAGLLTTESDVNYIFCSLLLASTGTQQALEEAGLDKQVKIVAFDTDNVTLDAIKSGRVEATVSQAPWCQGYWSMIYLYYIANNKITSAEGWLEKGYPSLPITADSGTGIVTAETADNYYTQE